MTWWLHSAFRAQTGKIFGKWNWVSEEKPNKDWTNSYNYSPLWPTRPGNSFFKLPQIHISRANCRSLVLSQTHVLLFAEFSLHLPIWLNILMPLKDKEGKNPHYMSKTAWKYFDGAWRLFWVLTSLHDVALFSYSDQCCVLEITPGPDIVMIGRPDHHHLIIITHSTNIIYSHLIKRL